MSARTSSWYSSLINGLTFSRSSTVAFPWRRLLALMLSLGKSLIFSHQESLRLTYSSPPLVYALVRHLIYHYIVHSSLTLLLHFMEVVENIYGEIDQILIHCFLIFKHLISRRLYLWLLWSTLTVLFWWRTAYECNKISVQIMMTLELYNFNVRVDY